jgi:HPt (histidine-containing phosphotransfer) domain-containing protein
MPQTINMEMIDELLSLSEDGDPELLVDLLEMFLEDGPGKVSTILAGLDRHDFDAVERAAHSLKGSAGNLGVFLVQEDCETLQIASRQHELATAQKAATRLRTHYRDAEAELRALLGQYKS